MVIKPGAKVKHEIIKQDKSCFIIYHKNLCRINETSNTSQNKHR